MPARRQVKRVCLAYSGGLDTSVILHWLIHNYGCEVVAFTADVGQEEELTRCLGELAEQVGGRRAERYRLMLEDVVNAVELLRKRSNELQSLLSGTSVINS